MRKAARDNMKIQLHLKLSFDIQKEMSASDKDNLPQPILVCLGSGHAPNEHKMNFLRPCQNWVAVRKRKESFVDLQQ